MKFKFLFKKVEGKPKEIINGIMIGVLIGAVLLAALGWYVGRTMGEGVPTF